MERAPTRAFSWFKAPTSTFTFKTPHGKKVGGLVSIESYSRLSIMVIALASQFNVVGTFNQDNAFSVIVKLRIIFAKVRLKL